MDAILKAVKKSPRPFSKSNGNKAKSAKHHKLPENWGDNNEPVREGVTFYVKYLGSTLVEELEEEGQSYGEGISTEAVKTIVNMAKMAGKKLMKMSITVSTNGIKFTDLVTKLVKSSLSIYRISFCTADKTHDKVFAYIARNTDNETMECHAFLCPKTKIAQAVTLTVAEAFRLAQEDWNEKEKTDQENQEKRSVPDNEGSESGIEKSTGSSCNDLVVSGETNGNSIPRLAMDGNEKNLEEREEKMDFEDSFNLEDEFSSLAQSRSSQSQSKHTNPFPHFSMGLRPEDIDDGVRLLMGGQSNADDLTRQPSVDDLLSL